LVLLEVMLHGGSNVTDCGLRAVSLSAGYCPDTLHFTSAESQRVFRFRYERNAGRLLVSGRCGVWKRKVEGESLL
jgi:hypothetical protein